MGGGALLLSTNVLVLSTNLILRALHTERRFPFDNNIAEFMRCLPRAGIIDETMSDAAGNVVLIFVNKVVHCSVLISPPLQSFTPICSTRREIFVLGCSWSNQ